MNKFVNLERVKEIVIHCVIWLFGITAIVPFLIMISTSFVKETYVLPYPPKILPDTFDLSNYIQVLNEANFIRYFLNSIFLSAVGTFFVLLVSSLSAYGFSRFDFPLKEFIFNVYLFTLMVPGILNIVAQYSIINSMHLTNTYLGVLLLYIAGGIAGNTFFLRGFFESLPHELEESVIIDGGSKWTIFRKIILPLSKPAIGTLAIGVFTGIWSDFFIVLTFIKEPSMWTLPVGIQLFRGQHATSWGLVFAATMYAFIPEILIFVIFQKYFVNPAPLEGGIKE